MTLLDERWLLPEGVEETLPPVAERMERARRDLLDLYLSWGYRLVTPPLVEHLESLLIGASADLEQQTFKLTDPMSGRMIGVRADMTPQVARIDARYMPQDSPARLCYLGTTLRTRADGLGGSRSPVQVGAELYGHAGVESDCEAILLMLATLERVGVANVHLDLGHVGVFRQLVAHAQLDTRREDELFEAMQRKASDEVDDVLTGVDDSQTRQQLRALIDLNGGAETLDEARVVLANAGPMIQGYIDDLSRLVEMLQVRGVGLPIHFDLAELRGGRYHSGAVFAAFVPGQGQEVARGGRYDDIERVYGEPRAATGFSSDLRTMVSLAVARQTPEPSLIEAPWSGDAKMLAAVAALRASGERVFFALPTNMTSTASTEDHSKGVNRRLCCGADGDWVVVDIQVEQLPK
jgi:ATP phosphoribosyltransferase regulatory subunit